MRPTVAVVSAFSISTCVLIGCIWGSSAWSIYRARSVWRSGAQSVEGPEKTTLTLKLPMKREDSGTRLTFTPSLSGAPSIQMAVPRMTWSIPPGGLQLFQSSAPIVILHDPEVRVHFESDALPDVRSLMNTFGTLMHQQTRGRCVFGRRVGIRNGSLAIERKSADVLAVSGIQLEASCDGGVYTLRWLEGVLPPKEDRFRPMLITAHNIAPIEGGKFKIGSAVLETADETLSIAGDWGPDGSGRLTVAGLRRTDWSQRALQLIAPNIDPRFFRYFDEFRGVVGANDGKSLHIKELFLSGRGLTLEGAARWDGEGGLSFDGRWRVTDLTRLFGIDSSTWRIRILRGEIGGSAKVTVAPKKIGGGIRIQFDLRASDVDADLHQNDYVVELVRDLSLGASVAIAPGEFEIRSEDPVRFRFFKEPARISPLRLHFHQGRFDATSAQFNALRSAFSLSVNPSGDKVQIAFPMLNFSDLKVALSATYLGFLRSGTAQGSVGISPDGGIEARVTVEDWKGVVGNIALQLFRMQCSRTLVLDKDLIERFPSLRPGGTTGFRRVALDLAWNVSGFIEAKRVEIRDQLFLATGTGAFYPEVDLLEYDLDVLTSAQLVKVLNQRCERLPMTTVRLAGATRLARGWRAPRSALSLEEEPPTDPRKSPTKVSETQSPKPRGELSRRGSR
jgi:hypothetical protein